MYTNAQITHYTKGNYAKSFFDVYLEQNSNRNTGKEGDRKSHALFISVPTKEEINFFLGDFIIVGKIDNVIDKTTEQSESESLRILKKDHQLFTISSITPCLYGSRNMWHYELECD